MRFTRRWLEEHLETTASDAELKERLTAIGLEVEDWHDPAEHLGSFLTARVLECRPHPQAQRLNLCRVRYDETQEPVQVVCGAHNVRTGFLGVFAPVGSVVPATGLRLKAASLQGEASHGMLLSEWELGLSEDHEGILELEEEELGKPLPESRTLGESLSDPVCSIAVTPNRADCLGVRGIARDLAAAGLGTLIPLPQLDFRESFAPTQAWRIDLPAETAHHCPFVCGRSFRNLQNKDAPRHIRARLKAVGVKSISALVDMTNYLTLDLARPLHVFDARKLVGDTLTIRKARAGESLHALDRKTYALPISASVIADGANDGASDGARVVGMAGIIGGALSGCDAATQEMFLECALFDPRATAATGRALNIESEARFRFERGVDPAAARQGCDHATALVLQWCGGEASTMTQAGVPPTKRRRILLPAGRVQKLGGIALPQKSVDAILARLGFEKEQEKTKAKEEDKNNEDATYTPPSWRDDVTTSACLVEEVLRIHGFDAVPDAVFARTTPLARRAVSQAQKRDALVRRRLALCGLYETITWSFVDSRIGEIFALEEGLRLQNPISAQLDSLRPTLLANLLATAAQNRAKGRRNTAFFEIGPQFSQHKDGITQEQISAGLRTGLTASRHWQHSSRDADIFDAKADLRAVFQACGLEVERLESTQPEETPDGYHPTRCGLFFLGRTLIGRFGELHPTFCRLSSLRGRAVAFEAFLDRLPVPKTRIAPRIWQRSKQQSLYRDFACWIPETLTAGALKSIVLKGMRNRLKALTFFDLYRAEDGETSLAFEVEILPHAERALTEVELQALSQEIENYLTGLGCRMRKS